MEVSKFLDHGTANPIVARLTSQTFAILDACNLSKEAADKIKVVYMQALTKTLVWCGEIAMRYQGEFRDETYSKALAEIVNAQHRQPLAGIWGPGRTASSDGQRFPAGGMGEQAGQINLRYGTEPGVLSFHHTLIL